MKNKKPLIIVLVILLCLVLGLVVYGIFSLAGFTGDNKQTDGQTAGTVGVEAAETTQVAATEEATTEEPTTEAAEPITLVFGGDVNFAYSFLPAYQESGISGVLSEDLLDLMTGADICMVNHEFCFSTRGVQQDKQYTFRVDPKYATALNEMGVDIVTLANNHALDYGQEALSDTFTTLDGVGIKYCGAGETKERAEECEVFEQNGKTIGFLAASRVIPEESWNIDNSQPGMLCTYNGTELCEAIKKAKETCDYVVVYVHWGLERHELPEDYQRSLGQDYIDAGADLVIGSHSHCLQGIEYYNGKPIFYSLGNYVFNTSIEKTMAVEVTLEECDASREVGSLTSTIRIHPAAASNGQTYLLEGDAAQNLIDYEESISFGVNIDEEGYVSQAE